MFKVMMFAAVAALIVAPAFAQESKMALADGKAVFVSPNETLQKSRTKVSDAHYEAALAKGANEISRGTVLYRHDGKLYGVSCVGRYIGDWEQGYPGTENEC